MFTVKCDVALPCATQNELRLEDAKALVENGCIAVAEGANMPTTLEATDYLREHGVLFAPGKAANAGGVATSALEMSQNSMRLSWSFDEVDAKLQGYHGELFNNIDSAAKEYGMPGNYVARREYRGLPQGGQRDGKRRAWSDLCKTAQKITAFCFCAKGCFWRITRQIK